MNVLGKTISTILWAFLVSIVFLQKTVWANVSSLEIERCQRVLLHHQAHTSNIFYDLVYLPKRQLLLKHASSLDPRFADLLRAPIEVIGANQPEVRVKDLEFRFIEQSKLVLHFRHWREEIGRNLELGTPELISHTAGRHIPSPGVYGGFQNYAHMLYSINGSQIVFLVSPDSATYQNRIVFYERKMRDSKADNPETWFDTQGRVFELDPVAEFTAVRWPGEYFRGVAP